VIGVFVVKKRRSAVDEQAVKTYCEKYLEPYKIPRFVWFIKQLPKTPNGKVDRKRLLVLAAKENKPRK
jgi:acyl-CoA synthetase (AMP-forming)/AMP-acid ligase II